MRRIESGPRIVLVEGDRLNTVGNRALVPQLDIRLVVHPPIWRASQSELSSGSASAVKTRVSRAGSGGSNDPSQRWNCGFQTRTAEGGDDVDPIGRGGDRVHPAEIADDGALVGAPVPGERLGGRGRCNAGGSQHDGRSQHGKNLNHVVCGRGSSSGEGDGARGRRDAAPPTRARGPAAPGPHPWAGGFARYAAAQRDPRRGPASARRAPRRRRAPARRPGWRRPARSGRRRFRRWPARGCPPPRSGAAAAGAATTVGTPFNRIVAPVSSAADSAAAQGSSSRLAASAGKRVRNSPGCGVSTSARSVANGFSVAAAPPNATSASASSTTTFAASINAVTRRAGRRAVPDPDR